MSLADGRRFRAIGGRYLKERRQAAGLTQADIARALGLPHVSRVSQWETGVAAMPSQYYLPFAGMTGTDLRALGKMLTLCNSPPTFKCLFPDEYEEARKVLGV